MMNDHLLRRKRGFYWVRIETSLDRKELAWMVAEWDGQCWWLPGVGGSWNEDDLLEIDERRIVRRNDDRP